MELTAFNIPCYPCDKELFPGSQFSPDNERESTTFYNDFKIAEPFGLKEVKDTFRRAFASWRDNIKYMTELTCVLNHLCWESYGRNSELSSFYSSAYYKCMDYVYSEDNNEKFSLEDRLFFHNVLD